MNNNDLQEKLTVDQRSTIAKIQVLVFNVLEKCKNDQEVAIFHHYLNHKLQLASTNRVLQLNNQFIETVHDEPANTDAVQEA